MGLSHRFDQVLSFAFGHVTQSCSCAPAIAGVRWIRSSVQVRFSSRLTIERLEGHAQFIQATRGFTARTQSPLSASWVYILPCRPGKTTRVKIAPIP